MPAAYTPVPEDPGDEEYVMEGAAAEDAPVRAPPAPQRRLRGIQPLGGAVWRRCGARPADILSATPCLAPHAATAVGHCRYRDALPAQADALLCLCAREPQLLEGCERCSSGRCLAGSRRRPCEQAPDPAEERRRGAACLRQCTPLPSTGVGGSEARPRRARAAATCGWGFCSGSSSAGRSRAWLSATGTAIIHLIK